MTDPTIERLQAVAGELNGRRRWFQSADVFRYAAVPLVTATGHPQDLATQVVDVAERLRRQAGWFSALRSEVRLLVAAMLVRDVVAPADFDRDFGRARSGFRRLGLRRSETFELFATLLLRRASGGVLPEDERVWRRLGDCHRQMKQQHRWWTGVDDYPAAALLAAQDVPLHDAIRRIEGLYSELRRAGIQRGNVLQLVSHLLYFAGGDDHRVARRFLDLKQALSSAGVWVWRSDFDEIALLATVDAPVRQLAREVVADRSRIKRMRPRPGGVVSFSVACGTTFLRHAEPWQSPLHDLQVLLQLHELQKQKRRSHTASASS